MGEMEDVYKQRMEKKKAALIASTTIAITLSVAISHIRKTTQRVQPNIYNATMPYRLCSSQIAQGKELLLFCSASDFVKLLNFECHCFFNILLQRLERVRSKVNFGSPFRKDPKKR